MLMPVLITSLIFSTPFFTASRVWAVTYACSGSFSPGKGWPSFLATFIEEISRVNSARETERERERETVRARVEIQ